MTAIRLHEVDMTGIVGSQPANPDRLSEVGVKSAPLMGGLALLTTAHEDPVARERNAKDAIPDNPKLLICLREAGMPVTSYKDFRQLETTPRAPRAQPGYRALLGFASKHIEEIGAQQRVDTSRRLGGTGGFRISLITDAAGERVFGFLGHNDEGERIFLSRDGDVGRVWYD